MMPSAASMISSPFAAACGFSIFAISGTSTPRAVRCSRTGSRSSRRRTNESAKKSTPMSRPASISAMSSSLTAGSETVTFGRLSPCRDATLPPTSTLVTTSPLAHLGHAQPDRAVGQVEHVALVDQLGEALPGHRQPLGGSLHLLGGEHHAASRAPSSATPPATGPMRSFGPGHVAEDRHLAASRAPPRSGSAAAISACSSGSPWAKFSRAMSMPAAIICSRTSGSFEAGPMVATILVERIALNIPTAHRGVALVQNWTNAVHEKPALSDRPPGSVLTPAQERL